MDRADVVLPVRLRGAAAAFPAIAEQGSLRIAGSSLTWRPDRHCAPTVDLSQYVVVGAATATGPGEATSWDVDVLALVLHGPQGPVALSGDLLTIGTIRQALRAWTPRAGAPGDPQPSRYPTRVVTPAARLWMAAWAVAAAFFVLRPTPTTAWYVPALVLAALAALVGLLVLRRALRIRTLRDGEALDAQAEVDLAAAAIEAEHGRPVLPAAGEQTYSRLATYLAQRAAQESWAEEPELRPRRWWVLAGRVRWALALAPIALFLVVFGIPWLIDLRVLATSPTAMAPGTVVAVTPGSWFPLAQAQVSFLAADGRKVSAFPPTQAARSGDVVTVRYVVADPAHATVVGPTDASTRAARLSIAAIALVVGVTGFVLTSRVLPALRGSRPGSELVRLPYLRVRHPLAGDGLVLFDPGYDSPPRWLVGLLGRLGPDVPLEGEAEFATRTGELGDGDWAHPVVAGRQWFASGRLVAIPGDRVDEFCRDVLTDALDLDLDD